MSKLSYQDDVAHREADIAGNHTKASKFLGFRSKAHHRNFFIACALSHVRTICDKPTRKQRHCSTKNNRKTSQNKSKFIKHIRDSYGTSTKADNDQTKNWLVDWAGGYLLLHKATWTSSVVQHALTGWHWSILNYFFSYFFTFSFSVEFYCNFIFSLGNSAGFVAITGTIKCVNASTSLDSNFARRRGGRSIFYDKSLLFRKIVHFKMCIYFLLNNNVT